MRSTFSHNPTFKTQDRLDLMEPMRKGMKGFIDGYYEDKDIVFDKCRGWTSNINLLDEILGNKDSKIIWTYRDPVDVVSSIEKRYQDTVLLENVDEASGMDFTTLDSRVNNYINDGGLIARPVWLLDDAFNMGYADRILIVRYWDLTNDTQRTMNQIHDFLGLPHYPYGQNEFKDLKQTTQEFDGMYNYKYMHNIREGGIEYKKHDINLPPHIIDNINKRFTWINDLAFGKLGDN
jgi:hypothetical protein